MEMGRRKISKVNTEVPFKFKVTLHKN